LPKEPAVARLFDAYIIADWTAAEGKKLGENSVWIGVAKRDVRFRLYTETHNVATRAEGETLLASILADHRKRGDRVLVGFDFNFGYPQGTAARLKLTGEPIWSAMWKFIASNIVDKADNTNNRYQVAAKMNRLMTDEAWPLWGAPANQAQRWLTTTKPPAGAGADIPEYPGDRGRRPQGQAAAQVGLADARRGRRRRPDPGRHPGRAPPAGKPRGLGRRLAVRHRLARAGHRRRRAAVRSGRRGLAVDVRRQPPPPASSRIRPRSASRPGLRRDGRPAPWRAPSPRPRTRTKR
jgi:hypothetical protein